MTPPSEPVHQVPSPPRDVEAWPCQSICVWAVTGEVWNDGTGSDLRVFACRGCGSEWVRTEPWTPIDSVGVVPDEVCAERARARYWVGDTRPAMVISARTPLTLRPWRAADADALLDAFNSPDMAQQGPQLASADDALRWIGWACPLTSRETGFVLAVTGPDDWPIGNVAVTDIDRHDTGWASYWTAASARRRNVASDALAGLAHWVHDEHHVARIELGHRVNNPGSCRVAEKAGFLAEGIERGKLCQAGVRYDVERHARLDTDPRVPLARPVMIAVEVTRES